MSLAPSGIALARRRPDVSVIIPLHNRAELLGYTLESLAPDRHAGVHLEVVVVDDGSTDDGAAIAERVTYVKVLRRRRRGAPAARNAGLANASADLVHFLDSDDLIEPGFHAPLLEVLGGRSEAAAAYGCWDHFRSAGPFERGTIEPRRTRYPIEPLAGISHLRRLLGGWYVQAGAIVWRRSTIESLGGQDERLLINQDVDLMFRALIGGALLAGVSSPRLLYREHVGDRQGRLESPERAAQVLGLRRCFVAALRERDMLGVEERAALSRFCFDQWRVLRHSMPDVAADFLDLARALVPRLELPGRLPLRMLARVIGAERAAVLRDSIPT